MTMLVSWIGIDTHGPSSAYIVTDSRISWQYSIPKKVNSYDHGKKVFASLKYPEIFGYVGDVLFPSLVLSQIVEMIDREILISPDMSCRDKNKVIFDKLSYELIQYPMECSTDSVQILHISRDTEVKKEKYPQFHTYFLSYNKIRNVWERTEKNIPDISDIISVLGSGKSEFEERYLTYQKGSNQSTSRNVFHCFVNTLSAVKDPSCGGAPQLVGIYRKPDSTGMYFGTIYNDKCYFAGTEVPKGVRHDEIEWRNENFERCSGKAKKILEGAQPQPDLLR